MLYLDKSLIVWKLTKDESSCGTPYKALKGHGHFVSDAVISSDGQFALSGSWDGTLRLWDIAQYVKIFILINIYSKINFIFFLEENQQEFLMIIKKTFSALHSQLIIVKLYLVQEINQLNYGIHLVNANTQSQYV